MEKLPKTPTPEQLRVESPWINELVRTIDDISRVLYEEGVEERAKPIWEAIRVGDPVPDDIRQPAIDFHNAWVVMLMRLRPLADNWLTRLDERAQKDDVDRVAAEWSKAGGALGEARGLRESRG